MSPPWAAFTAAASGPMALATSLEPWAKATAQAVRIWSTANTRSTLEKRFFSSGGSLRIRFSRKKPNTAPNRPSRAESPTDSPRSKSRFRFLRPL